MVIGTDRDRKTGALRALLAHNDGSGLNYAGAAFIALAGEERAQFLGELERLTTSWAAFKSSLIAVAIVRVGSVVAVWSTLRSHLRMI